MKDVKNFEGQYAITSCGKVWSYQSRRFLKPTNGNYGYKVVNLCKEGKVKQFLIHRLVAEAYIENPNGFETVDHIDGNKEHNYINNLQWMTRSENGIKGNNKSVKCLETGQIFNSATIAAREMNLNRGNISSVCRGERGTTGGYHFEYI